MSEETPVAESWRAVRDDDAIQFEQLDLTAMAEREPTWWDRLLQWLGELLAPAGEAFGSAWPLVRIGLVLLAALLVLLLLWRLLAPWIERMRARQPAVEAGWTPDAEAARALLADAERLAAAGNYDEAVHLLLRRSVDQIGDARPDWLAPSSTAREIATLDKLPEAARSAFATIAQRVERALWALRRLDRSDWEAAREAYARFALADLRRA